MTVSDTEANMTITKTSHNYLKTMDKCLMTSTRGIVKERFVTILG